MGNAPPVKGLGTQIQDQGIYGYPPEATVAIAWEEREGKYKDGTPYAWRYPHPEIVLPNGEPLFPEVLTSLRVPLPVFGLGLIEAIPEETIRNLADPDDRPNFLATGREWRTQSLWGIGLTQTVLPYSGYLHDGRARTLEETILWHGGEAENSQAQFQA
ncbi:MAG: di-heme oxidoredictase family protein, partial [Spirulina sp.]